jgi:hypothetical protein
MHVPWRKRVSRRFRGHLRSLALSNHGIGVVAETGNGLLIVDPKDFGVSSALLQRGSYDLSSIAWLLPLLDAQSRIVFGGAHLGSLLVPIALRSQSHQIVAFEPAPHNHRLLKLNLALNSLTSVVVHQLAIGDSEGSVHFTENPINTGNSRISRTGEVIVPVTTLDVALLLCGICSGATGRTGQHTCAVPGTRRQPVQLDVPAADAGEILPGQELREISEGTAAEARSAAQSAFLK